MISRTSTPVIAGRSRRPRRRGRASVAAAAGLRTRRTGTSISILGVDGRKAFEGERRPANLEDVFVLLTGEEIE